MMHTVPVCQIANVLLLRLSKDDDAMESIDVQRSNALSFVAKQRWGGETIELIAKGESGAEIRKRSDLVRLLKLAEERHGAIRVIMRNQDRLARDAKWTAWLLCELETRGVPEGAIWVYDTGRTIATRGTEYALTALEGVRAEGEWESNSKRRREALRYRVLDGRASRAAPWGYIRTGEGRNKRWQIDARVADTIVTLGRLFIETGGSLRGTAAAMNHRGIESPGSFVKGGEGKRSPGKWTSRSVAHVLRTPYYRGELVHGATNRVRQAGSVVTVTASEDNVLRVARPELRIWPEALLSRIDELLARIKRCTPYRGTTAAHLGSSFLRCGMCGGSMAVVGSSRGGHSYVCVRASGTQKTGCSGCGYKSEAKVDRALLEAIAPLVGDGDIAKLALAFLKERIDANARPDGRDTERERLRRAVAEAERMAKNLARAISMEDGDQSDLLADRKEALKRTEELRAELAKLDQNLPSLDGRRLLERARGRLTELADLHALGGVQARPVLEALLGDKRFKVVPVEVDGKRDWRMKVQVEKGYLAALVGAPWADPSASDACPSCRA
jgi:CheY-like chemotaxis protein